MGLRNTTKITLLLFILLLALGCAKSHSDHDGAVKPNVSLEIRIAKRDNPSSKIEIEEKENVWSVKWSMGDEIGAWIDSQGASSLNYSQLDLIDVGDGYSAVFSGNLEGVTPNSEIYTLYPLLNQNIVNGKHSIILSEQRCDPNDTFKYLSEATYMYGDAVTLKQSDQGYLPHMRHLVAYLDLKLKINSICTPSKLVKVEFSGATSKGEFDIKQGTLQGDETLKTITVELLPSEFIESGSVVDLKFGIVPFEILAGEGIAITLYFEDERGEILKSGQMFEKIAGRDMNFGSGKFHYISFNDIDITSLVSANGNCEMVTSKELEMFEEYTTKPDYTSPITINTQKSVIQPSDLLRGSVLNFSYLGGRAVVEFDGKFDKTMTLTGNDDGRVTVTPLNSTFRNSRLEINVSNPFGSDSTTVIISLKNTFMSSYKGFDLVVKIDRHQIPTVMMGGLEWMVYNGISRDNNDYDILEVEQSVRDVYAKKWDKYTLQGMWYERTRDNTMRYPWEVVRTEPNAERLSTAGLNWVAPNDKSIPCPEGWRLPSFNEYATIWPANNAVLPATYIRNNVTYTAKIENATSEKLEFPLQAKNLVISDGTSELIFPVTGYRIRDDYNGRAAKMATNISLELFLWTQNAGGNNWTAKPVGIFYDNSNRLYKGYYTYGNSNHSFSEAYNSARCVKVQ